MNRIDYKVDNTLMSHNVLIINVLSGIFKGNLPYF